MVSRIVSIVDDDLAVLDSLRLLVELGGYKVITYNSASAFLDEHRTDVACLIVDHNMPRMTGLDLAARVLADGSDVAVLLITGSLSPDLVARANDLGVEVLEKPPDENELLRFLNQRF